jgi:hypothetical protein
MRKKQIVVLTIFITILSVSSVSMISMLFTYDEPEIRDYVGIDGTSLLKDKKPYSSNILQTSSMLQTSAVGDTWVVTVSDDFTGEMYDQEFEMVLEGEKCNFWIGLSDEDYDGFSDEHVANGEGFEDDVWYFAYPWSAEGIAAKRAHAPDPDGDGYYLPPEYRDWITGQDLLNMRAEFDGNIHDGVVTHFGEYADRPGPLDDYKIQVLIFNMRDGLFYDPYKSGWFIMGYFWSYVSELFDSNIFHMDTYQWWRRAGTPTESYYGLSPLPLQYDGTFAHEFQHLVHYDVDSDELSWVDEGCATLAEWVCGYGFSPGHISEYLLNHHLDALTYWQGNLYDYGGVFLWTYYMWEHYGDASLIWDLTHEQLNGIDGWRAILAGRTEKTFDEIFHDWMLANYFDDTELAVDGIYGYYELDIPSSDSEDLSIPLILESTPDLYDKVAKSGSDTTLPYTANYIEFHYHPGSANFDLAFNGDVWTGIEAYSGEYKMSSNGDAWAWYRFHQYFDLTGLSTATLNFWTQYDIELDWDYGYVEVHDLTMDTWCTLEGTNTVDTLPKNEGIDNENCPGDETDWGLEPTGYYEDGLWNAFTGTVTEWYQEEMDLTQFAGHEIEIYFTYWTDPYTIGGGWFVDDISIPELSEFDDFEGISNWVIDNGWTCDSSLHYNDFEVDLITIDEGVVTSMESMILNDDQYGTASFELSATLTSEKYVLMVVANQPGYTHTFTTGYEWTIVKL